MKLPNCDRALVDIRKLREYSLNPEHEMGSHKARVFRSALGLTLADVDWLYEEVIRIANECDVVIGERSHFGEKYVIDARITFGKHSAIVRMAWIVENGTDFPRLASCYVK
jgi:hypothetical protein